VIKLTRRQVATSLAALPLTPRIARSQSPIRIGETISYTAVPAYALPYRNGWQLALEMVNAEGGVLKAPLEVVSRDDGGKPGDAVRVVEELVSREKVALLFGQTLSNIGLAVNDLAKRNHAVYLPAEVLTDALTLEQGTKYTMRHGIGTYTMAAQLFNEAKKGKHKRWALLMPNYEYGQSTAVHFRRLVAEQTPNAKIVVEQFPPLGKADGGAVVEALLAAEPDAIFNGTFGTDLLKIVREGKLRGLYDGRQVYSLVTGSPEWLDNLKDEAPVGWRVTGYPWQSIKTPEHTKFFEAYVKKYGTHPTRSATVGFAVLNAAVALIERAGSTGVDALVAAMPGLSFMTPYGPIKIRPEDHQGNTGAYVGTIAVENGRGIMRDVSYVPGDDYLISLDEVKTKRPAN
jgi:branched-chain amino acid transport system substrate-binding protein